jgi:UrcA family protein
MMKTMAIAASVVATATLFAVTPGVAAAAEAGQSVAVHVADLDLATPKGQKQLERRIDRAARAVCGMDDGQTGTRLASQDAAACYRLALRQVRERVAAAKENKPQGS